ncbi:MAG: VTT domain-containing protein [Candidatus Niyogibacteria bacterium]|nr:VTT domain-containing protein [Candidatus Niyogibacteria bacterium]
MNSIIFSYLTHWRSLGYALVFIGMIIEGDIILFTSSFLAHQGFFNIGDLMFFALAGVLIGDLLWYLLGCLMDNHINNNSNLSFVARWIARIAKPLDAHLLNRSYRTIFISKFAFGFHHALLTRLGMLRFSWKKFIKIDFISAVPWMIIVGGLGYFSGAAFFASKHYLRLAETGLLITLVLFLAIEHFVIKKLKL